MSYRTMLAGLSISQLGTKNQTVTECTLTGTLRPTSVKQFLQHRQILISNCLHEVDILAHCAKQ